MHQVNTNLFLNELAQWNAKSCALLPLWGWLSLQAGRCRWLVDFGVHCHHCELWIVNFELWLWIVIIVNALTIFDEYLLSANWLEALTKAKIFFHKNIVCNLVQVWSVLFYFSKLESQLAIGNFRLNRRKEITISFPFATCSLSNWCRS